MSGDPRVTLARPDLAAATLEGIVRAARFVKPVAMQLRAPFAAIRSRPRADAEQVDQLLFGEIFDVAETGDGWAWGQARRDGYVGFVAGAALSDEVRASTHRVAVPCAWAFRDPSIKSPAAGPLDLNALVTVTEARGALARAADIGWIAAVHLAPVGSAAADPAAVAETLLGTPYLWGGRGVRGLDCSGLVQQALLACAAACPRDADQQGALGEEVPRQAVRRGDLVRWPGHIGMMLDEARLIHANAHHMAVAIEALDAAIWRIGPPTALRGLSRAGLAAEDGGLFGRRARTLAP
ncbi:MAG: NlpC/P60 family protein [Caulobacteraceae bacterium]